MWSQTPNYGFTVRHSTAYTLHSSRTTSEFAIKWSQAEHCCTPPPVPRLWCSQCCDQFSLFCSWLMRSRAVGFLYSSDMVTVTSPWLMIMFTLASKLIRVQLKISVHHRSRYQWPATAFIIPNQRRSRTGGPLVLVMCPHRLSNDGRSMVNII